MKKPRVLHTFESLAESWISDATKRKAVTATDPVADTLKYAAAELLERVRLASCDTDEMTAEEFAARHQVLPATVRRWCKSGRIGARLTPNGYRIPADAIPPMRKAS